MEYEENLEFVVNHLHNIRKDYFDLLEKHFYITNEFIELNKKTERLKEAVLLLCEIVKECKPTLNLENYINLTK